MNIAIPIWDDCVSNVFDFAVRILLLEIDNDKEITRYNILLESQSLSQRVDQLKFLNVDILICGAISRTLAELASASGIQVLPYITGRVEDVLEAYRTGQLAQSQFAMPGCWPGARKDFGRRQRGCRWLADDSKRVSTKQRKE